MSPTCYCIMFVCFTQQLLDAMHAKKRNKRKCSGSYDLGCHISVLNHAAKFSHDEDTKAEERLTLASAKYNSS